MCALVLLVIISAEDTSVPKPPQSSSRKCVHTFKPFFFFLNQCIKMASYKRHFQGCVCVSVGKANTLTSSTVSGIHMRYSFINMVLQLGLLWRNFARVCLPQLSHSYSRLAQACNLMQPLWPLFSRSPFPSLCWSQWSVESGPVLSVSEYLLFPRSSEARLCFLFLFLN